MTECVDAVDVLQGVRPHPRGYRRISRRGRWVLCHRLVYEECFGDPGELMVLHRCDNRVCVNPEHLFLGTAQNNMDDMVEKGRSWPGPRKLTPEQAAFIRSSKASNQVLAVRFAISRQQVGKIKRGEKWKSI